MLSWYTSVGDDRNRTRAAQILLSVLGHLPAEFAPYRGWVALLASGASQVYGTTDELRRLTRGAGLHSDTSNGRLLAQIDRSVADLLTCERIHLILGPSEPPTMRNDSLYPEDDFVRGAVIVCINDHKPDVGLIVQVEQKAWNAGVRGWDKTLTVQFGQQERRINPYTRTNDAKQNQPRVIVLLRAADTMAILHNMRDRPLDGGKGQFLQHMDRQAS